MNQVVRRGTPTSVDGSCTPRRNREGRREQSRAAVGAAIAVAVLALALRMVFVGGVLERPESWDGEGYRVAAQEIVRLVRNLPEEIGNIKAVAQEAMKTDFVSNEEAGFKAVQRYGISHHIYRAVATGPIYPVFLASFYFLNDALAVARIVQAFIGALTCVLVYLIGRKLFGFRSALLAGILAAAYTPFVLAAGQHLSETLSLFLLALTVWALVQAMESSRLRLFLLAGFFVASVMLERRAMQYIVVFLLAILIAWWWKSKVKPGHRYVVAFLAGLMLLEAPWLLATGMFLHRPLLGGPSIGGRVYYQGGYLPNDGWHSDMPGGLPLGLVMARNNHTSPSDIDYSEAFLLVVRQDPAGYGALLLRKLYRFWELPYNFFKETFILDPTQQAYLHRFIVLLALPGIVLSLRRGWPALVPLSVVVYVVGIVALVDSTIRYNLPAMPFLIVFAGKGLDALFQAAKGINSSRFRRPFYAAAFVGAALFLLLAFGKLPALLQAIPEMSPNVGHALNILLTQGAIFTITVLIYFLVVDKIGRKPALAACCSLLAIVLGTYSVHAYTETQWHEWKARLSGGSAVIGQELDLPQDLSAFRKATLKIDMLGGADKSYALLVKANGSEIKRYPAGLSVGAGDKVANDRDYRLLLRYQNRRPEDMRQWFEIPIDLSTLPGQGRLRIEVSIEGQSPVAGGYVDIFGDYDTSDDWFDGPSLNTSKVGVDTSFPKYIGVDDFRLWRSTWLASRQARSEFYDGSSWSSSDLSPERGKQTGRYRIYLELQRSDGSTVVL